MEAARLHGGSHVGTVMTYIRLVLWYEFVGLGAFWLVLFIVALVVRADAILLALEVVPALHYVAPFAGLEVMSFYSDKWLDRPRKPPRYDVARWIAQCLVTLLADAVALSVGVRIDLPVLHATGHDGIAAAYVTFLALFLFSTMLFTIAMILLWRSMVHYIDSRTTQDGKDKKSDIQLDEEDKRLLTQLRREYRPQVELSDAYISHS